MGETRLPLRVMTLFQRGGASKHKLRTRYEACRFKAQKRQVPQNCHRAHVQSASQSIMFTNVDLHRVQEYHDKVHGDPRKLSGYKELASFNFEKRDLASFPANIGSSQRRRFCVVHIRRDSRDESQCHDDNDSACADDLDEAASMASSVVEKDVDVKDLTGASKEILLAIIQRLDISTILSGTGLGRTNNGAEAYVTNGKLNEFDCTLLAKHRRTVLQQIGSQPSSPQSTESATRSVLFSSPRPFSFHQVLSFLAASRVTDDGDVHPSVVCQCSVLTLGSRAPHEKITVCQFSHQLFTRHRSLHWRSSVLSEVLKSNVNGIVC